MKISHATQIKKQNQSVKQRIQKLLGWNDLDYNNYQFEMAYQWLHLEFGSDYPLVKPLTEHKMFWNWWINHWIMRDIKYLEANKHSLWNITEETYAKRHHPKGVVFKIHKAVLQQSYMQMIGQFNKHLTNG